MSRFTEHKAVHITLILLTFICTGLTLSRVGGWLAGEMGWLRFSLTWWFMWVALLPVYYLFLLGFAFIFGKYAYFRAKVARTWARIRKLWSS